MPEPAKSILWERTAPNHDVTHPGSCPLRFARADAVECMLLVNDSVLVGATRNVY